LSKYAIYCEGARDPENFDSMSLAIQAACEMIASGRIVTGIHGTEGFVMERRDIELECFRRSNPDFSKKASR
jgi:hypothetical protein